MKLSKRQWCPLHHSLTCCGRAQRTERIENKLKHRVMRKPEQKKGWTLIRAGVWRIEDPTNPRGYRERRNKTAMTHLLITKVREQEGMCAICNQPMETFENIAPDHKDPRGSGGQWRDDHPENIQAVHHYPCNLSKGSRRTAEPSRIGLSTVGSMANSSEVLPSSDLTENVT